MTTTTARPSKPRAKKKLAPVLVTMVLDRSGSMGCVKDETIEAFNAYVEGLRHDEGESFVTLRQFDHLHDLVYLASPAKQAVLLTHDTYEPRGSTALNDAIAFGIADADRAASDLPAGTKNLLVVVTDGFENASTEHTQESIKALVAEREERGWTVVFLQGNLDVTQAQHAASFYGVAAGNVAVYDTAFAGSTSGTMAAMNTVTTSLRSSAGGSSSAFADAGLGQDYRQATGIWTPEDAKKKGGKK